MKKIIAVLLAVFMVLSLAACGSKAEEPASSSAETPAQSQASQTETPAAPAETEPETGSDEYTPIRPEDPWQAFVDLVNEYDGFEIAYSRTEDRQVYAGGKDNCFWLLEIDDQGTEQIHYGVLNDGSWTEYFFETIDGETTFRDDGGNAIARICDDFAYYGQDSIDCDPRTPAEVTNADVVCDRYTYSMGAFAYDIAREYGVTVRYSYIDDPRAGFELEYIRTGADVEMLEMPEASIPEGDIDDPYYWDDLFGVNVCPFYVTVNGVENTYYFRGGGSFIQWLNTENNTEGWYYYNDRIITRDGKWAVEPGFDDAFSSFCDYEMTPYDGPTLSEEEQKEIRKGEVYAIHNWTPMYFASWSGLILEGEEYPAEDAEFGLRGLRTDFCDQEWINIFYNNRGYYEEELLDGHARVYAFPHKDITEYNGYINEEDEAAALTSADYLLAEDPDRSVEEQPIFNFYIPDEYQGAAFAGDVDLIFTYDGVITYFIEITTHESGWTM